MARQAPKQEVNKKKNMYYLLGERISVSQTSYHNAVDAD